MRKLTIARGLLFVGIAGIVGCANSDYANERKTREGVTINDSHYASAEENDQNAFGREGSGLSSNPETKPSAEELGAAGSYHSVEITAEPMDREVYVNDVLDVKFTFKGVAVKRGSSLKPDEEEEVIPIASKTVVIILERPNDADGTLSFVSGSGTPTSKSDTKIVAKTNNQGEVVVRLHTGTVYHATKPMYYINGWHADGNGPGSAQIRVKRVPQKGDPGYTEGSKNTTNDVTAPDDINKNPAQFENVVIKNGDALKQEVFVNTTKRLRVQLMTVNPNDLSINPEMKAITGKDWICWKLVKKAAQDGAEISGVFNGDVKDVKDEGCAYTDDTGAFWVEYFTGMVYNERYYINFFHANAAPLSYQIDTFIAPETLGEQGDDAKVDPDGDGKPGIAIGEDTSKVDEETGKKTFSPGDTRELIEEIFGKDPEKEPRKSIDEQCDPEKSGKTCEESCTGFDCSSGYMCRLVEQEDGTWAIIKCDGTEVKADVDGDCNCEDPDYKDKRCRVVSTEKIDEETGLCTEGTKCSADGKSCVDTVHVVIEKDEEGNIHYEGVDTDGDGKSDVAPDICLTSKKTADLCPDSPKFSFSWSKHAKQNFYTQKLSTPIGEDFTFYVKTRNMKGSGTNETGIEASVVRGEFPSNDGMLKLGSKEVENLTFDTQNGGVSPLVFWSGKAYGSLYYIQLNHEDANIAYVPIATTNVIPMPSGEGDAPSDDVIKDKGEAVTPPSDMQAPDPNLGKCQIFVAPEDIAAIKNGEFSKLELRDDGSKQHDLTSLETPIARTLILNASILCDRNAESKEGNGHLGVAKNTKTYWKLTRGQSAYNNGTLLNSTKVTDFQGIASTQFYAGTGYGSTYYVSVFHPNSVVDSKCISDKKSCEYVPAIFEIKTANSKGVVPGVGENDDPVLPGDETGKDKDGNSGICCNNIDECASCNEDKIDCTEVDKRSYIYCEGEMEKHGDKPEVNKTLPERACQEGETLKEGERCLELEIVEKNPLRTYINISSWPIKVKLQVRTGVEGGEPELEPVSDTVYMTMNKNDGADGYLKSETATSSIKSGVAQFLLNTGTVTTSYKLTATHPNYKDENGLIPVSMIVSVVDKSQLALSAASKNILNARTDEGDDVGDRTVTYYVLSNEYNQCNSKFAAATKTEAQKSCKAAQGPSSWKDAKKNNGVSKDDMCGVDSNTDSTQAIEVPNNSSRYMVYAVKYEGERPVSYGCVDMLYLPNATCVKQEIQEIAGKEETVCIEDQASMNLTVPMQEIPLTLEGEYNTKSLIDLGPLVAFPDSSECAGENNSIPCFINNVTEVYRKFIDSNPGEKIMGKLEDFLLDPDGCMSDTGAGTYDKDCQDSAGAACANVVSVSPRRYCKDEKTCVDCNPESATNNCSINSTCPNVTTGDYPAANYPNFKKSKCICAKIAHYTNSKVYCQNDQCWKLGGTVKDLAVKLLENLINKAFEKAAIEDNLCKVVDALQFIEFNGKLNVDASQGTSQLGVVLSFNGVKIPYLDESIKLNGRVVSGRASNASMPTGSTTLMIPDMGLNFSYGSLITDILASLLPEDAVVKDENTGIVKLELGNMIKCSSFFGGDIKIPLVNITLPAAMLDGLCSVALSGLSDKVYNLSEQQYVNLNMNLNGSGEVGSTDTTCKPSSKGGCQADKITNGLWSGTAVMRGQKENITGLWVAAKKEVSADGFPQLSYGDKTVEEYMAEHSICRKKLREDDTAIENVSNQACLGGTFDHPKARVYNNKCSNASCKDNTSIVVCKDGQLNALYANATAAEIIKAANAACADKENDEQCKANSEIINGGKGLTNEECIANYDEEKCQNNVSIVVMKGDDNRVDYDRESCNCQEKEDVCTDAEQKACINNACKGQCDNPGCVMNREVDNCKMSDDAPAAPPAAVIIASQNFNTYSTTKALQTAFENESGIAFCNPDKLETKDGEETKANCEELPGLKIHFVSESGTKAALKAVQGPDGNVGAVGTDAAIHRCESSCELKTGYFRISGAVAGQKITKITFQVMGAGRDISFGSDTSNLNSNKYASTESTWETKEITFDNGVPSVDAFIAPAGNAADWMKVMRIDDIVVYGVEVNN